MKNWENVRLVREFSDQGVDCYKLAGGDYVNEYYVVSEAETRKLRQKMDDILEKHI